MSGFRLTLFPTPLFDSNTINIESDADDSSIDIQGSVFSLRKIRSGRVV